MTRKSLLRRLFEFGAACVLAAGTLTAWADDPAALRAKYDAIRGELRSNPYGRPMYVESSEGDRSLRGDVYAVLDHPFDTVSRAMKDPAQWCDIMILPFNTKYCRAQDAGHVAMRIGRKYDQPVEQAYRLDFAYRNLAASPEFYESHLAAPQGPVGTRDYRITVSAIPLDGGRTFMHLGYSYGYGTAGRFAMQMYLSTAGADKVGFSVAGRDPGGRPQYIGGVRGAIERNVMRYYLAIDAYLDSLESPKAQQVDRRINTWFDATERYARQLHEMDRSTYVSMKKQEYERQNSLALQ
ncbi:MAG TPA: hypothetical protein VHA82_01065 [Ramlibacter sp.]|uniref:hypothetical protein n=1 Tax=Ramlibacter sp. TaxID=1917967 RepID=UPI002BC91516|nr:hypothetical protein [Ramlibacter sp.]HVZ42371.1 hypothetical protein [Ramlibacter sp.]